MTTPAVKPSKEQIEKALAWAADAMVLTVAGQVAHVWLVADIVENAPVLALAYRATLAELEEAKKDRDLWKRQSAFESEHREKYMAERDASLAREREAVRVLEKIAGRHDCPDEGHYPDDCSACLVDEWSGEYDPALPPSSKE